MQLTIIIIIFVIMFSGGISSIPGETVIPLWLGRFFLIRENRVYHEKVRKLLSRISYSITHHYPL